MKYQYCIKICKANYTKQYNNWFPKKYLHTFNEQIIPKFLNTCIDDTKKRNWQNYFDVINPKNSLGYFSEDLYLQDNELTKEDIVKNSIKHIFTSLENEDIELLQKYFLELIYNEKVKVLKESNIYRDN